MLSEIENYLQRIENLHSQIANLVSDLPAEALNWRPFERLDEHVANSIAVLATHVAGAEHFWIAEAIGGQPPTRDREAEFVTETNDAADLRRLLEQAGQETRQILTALSETDLNGSREVRGKTVSVRWIILHVVDHTALHLGHMQITYQLWQGGQSVQAPRWFDRLPPGAP